MSATPEDDEAGGLLDVADAAAAAVRRQLLDLLAERGFTAERVRDAHRAGRLFGLAGDDVLMPGGRQHDLEALAAQAGADTEVVGRLWRALGLADGGHGAPVATDGDVEAMRGLLLVADRLGLESVIGLARVIGAAADRVADATAAISRSSTQAAAVATSNELDTARYWLGAAELISEISKVLDSTIRHQIEATRRRFEASASYDLMTERLSRMAVGFIDISDYTVVSQRLTAAELSHLVARFEAVVSDAFHGGAARVVKFVGDAAMAVSPSKDELLERVLQVVETDGWADPLDVGVRAGVSWGPVLLQEGDVFGPPVNLAARLLGVAEPGQVVCCGDDVTSLDGSWSLASLGVHHLKGYEAPVEVHHVTR